MSEYVIMILFKNLISLKDQIEKLKLHSKNLGINIH